VLELSEDQIAEDPRVRACPVRFELAVLACSPTEEGARFFERTEKDGTGLSQGLARYAVDMLGDERIELGERDVELVGLDRGHQQAANGDQGDGVGERPVHIEELNLNGCGNPMVAAEKQALGDALVLSPGQELVSKDAKNLPLTIGREMRDAGRGLSAPVREGEARLRTTQQVMCVIAVQCSGPALHVPASLLAGRRALLWFFFFVLILSLRRQLLDGRSLEEMAGVL